MQYLISSQDVLSHLQFLGDFLEDLRGFLCDEFLSFRQQMHIRMECMGSQRHETLPHFSQYGIVLSSNALIGWFSPLSLQLVPSISMHESLHICANVHATTDLSNHLSLNILHITTAIWVSSRALSFLSEASASFILFLTSWYQVTILNTLTNKVMLFALTHGGVISPSGIPIHLVVSPPSLSTEYIPSGIPMQPKYFGCAS